jgi:PHD/YefM family antitoxin component YafN of YafNO toxin-antitoxin module
MSAEVNLQRIHPVSDFVRNYKAYLTRLKETREPEVLTVNGVPECVLIDAETFEDLRQLWAKEQFVKAVQEGIDSIQDGGGISAEDAFQAIRKSHDL